MRQTWPLARATLAAVLAIASLIVLATLTLLAFDAWRTRRRRAGHRWP